MHAGGREIAIFDMNISLKYNVSIFCHIMIFLIELIQNVPKVLLTASFKLSIRGEIGMTNKIIKMISEIKEDPSLLDTLNGQSDIIGESGMDSLQLINFILKVEDEFEVEIDFDEFDLSHLGSIDKFLHFIDQRK